MATPGGNVNVKERLQQFERRNAPKQPQTGSGANISGTRLSRNNKDLSKQKQPQTGSGANISGIRLSRNSKDLSKQNDGALFKEPARFIFTDEETGKLCCDEKTVQQLSEIMQPLNVVAITGIYRTGKSFLLNRLAGVKGGFKTGHRTRSCTKGIWVWCRHHPYQEDQVLVLLDVEGLGDLEKTNRKEDTWLFTLATVLSSTLIYNNKNTLDSYALDRLNFLEEIDSTIQISQEEDYEKLRLDFDFYFPSFVVALRDFEFEMVNRADQICTPDEYLEELLDQKKGSGETIDKYNKVRLLIRRYFKKRKCFAFNIPCADIKNLDNIPDGQIHPDFLKTVDEFSDYILGRGSLQLKSGRRINGRMFSNLAQYFVTDMGNDKQPSITEAREHMVKTENKAIVVAASDIYKKEMQQYLGRLGQSVPKDEALVKTHEIFMSRIFEVFKTSIVFEDEEVVRNETMGACKEFKRICDGYSTKACQDAITRLNTRIEKKLEAGTYCCMSGYNEYMQDIDWIFSQYNAIPGLGSQSKQILQEYLDGKEDEEERVYKMVVWTQTGTTDSDKPPPKPKRQSIRFTDVSARRHGSFSNSLKTQVKKLEMDMRQTVSEQHTKEKKTIKETYIENLKSKIEELQRQKSEQSDVMKALKEIEGQIAYLDKIYAYAMATDDSMEDTMSDKDTDEELSAEWEDDKSTGKGKRSFCRMQ